MRHNMHNVQITRVNRSYLLLVAIFLPIQTILHPHNVGQLHNTIQILFVLTAPKVRRRGHPYPCLLSPPLHQTMWNTFSPCTNLANPLHPVYDDGKGGGWKWWE